MFSSFDFKLLDDAEFKEDSVREELVAPILAALGYSASGANKIIRSKSLIHPYVYIGSKKHPITIIPDYLLSTSDGEVWILDAKAPNQDVTKGKGPEQAFSYAIHPDVRAKHYALCNGRQFSVFHVSKIQPLAVIDIEKSMRQLEVVRKILAPEFLKHPEKAHFLPDYGVHMLKAGWNMLVRHHWHRVGICDISKASDDIYTSTINKQFFKGWYCVSLDFGPRQLEQLLRLTSSQRRVEILRDLSQRPFSASFDEDPIFVSLQATFSDRSYISETGAEEFIPLQVHKFSNPPRESPLANESED